jgi:hypothetical protein
VDRNRTTAGRLAEDHDVVGIAAKAGNVALHPLDAKAHAQVRLFTCAGRTQGASAHTCRAMR